MKYNRFEDLYWDFYNKEPSNLDDFFARLKWEMLRAVDL